MNPSFGAGLMAKQEVSTFNSVRGISAIAVCASHLRPLLFVQMTPAMWASPANRIFYWVTGLGHQSVMVFFVMSGWLVGGSVWNQRDFSWPRYAITRLSRLLVVLIPALIATFAFDSLGIWLSHGDGYDGSRYAELFIGPSAAAPLNLSPLTALGNLLFLQTILVPVYGTNGPLWSLANEFWYYLVFPLFALVWRVRRPSSIALAVAGLAVLVLLPSDISAAFTIWLFGWAASILSPMIRVPKTACALSGVLLLAALLWAHSHQQPIIDYVLGLTVAALLASLKALPQGAPRFPWIRALFSKLANISYSLYLFHFPPLAFFFFSMHLHPQQPSPMVYLEFAVGFCLVIAFSTACWYLFERNTDTVRRLISGCMAIRAPAEPVPDLAGPP